MDVVRTVLDSEGHRKRPNRSRKAHHHPAFACQYLAASDFAFRVGATFVRCDDFFRRGKMQACEGQEIHRGEQSEVLHLRDHVLSLVRPE